MARETGKRWLFPQPRELNERYMLETLSDLSKHLLDMEARLTNVADTSAETAAIQNSIEALSSTVSSLTGTIASILSSITQLQTRLVRLGIGTLEVPAGYGLIMFDEEKVTGTLTNNGTIICI